MSNGDQVNPRHRLSAILFADIADLPHATGDDGVALSQAVAERIDAFARQAESRGGQVLQSDSDGLFLLFDSAVDAVSFAVDVQKTMAALNQTATEDRQFWFRIGINLGEILLGAGDASGESVSVAARIKALAPPGKVCISAAVYHQVRNRLDFGYSYLGPKTLDGIGEPVDVFKVLEESAAGRTATGYRRPVRRRRMETNPVVGPSVVVLPFRFLGSDPAESWFADGLTEDVTTNLSRFHHLFVIARTSAYVFGNGGILPGRAARELGVGYAVTGSFRKAGPRVRITVQLLDADQERALWAEQYDRNFDDILQVQEEITETIVAALAIKIEAVERERLALQAPSDMRAYACVLQGQQHIFHYTREDNRRARILFDDALSVDARYARAIAAKSRTLNVDCLYGWAELRAQALDNALDLALTAVELDPADARGFGELGYAHLWRNEHDAAVNAYRRALHLNPNDAELMSDMAEALDFSGHSEEAVELLQKAMRLNPFHPDEYLWHLGGAYYNLERYEDAIQAVSAMQNPRQSYRILAASHAQLGRMAEARAYAAKVLEEYPDFDAARWASVLPEAMEELRLRYIEGLRKAGL